MNTQAELRIRKLAADQANLVTRAQALEAGYSTSTVSRRATSGVWRAVFRGVYAIGAHPDPWRQQVLAAVLAAGRGAVASHDTAWVLHDLDMAAKQRQIHVTVATDKPRDLGDGVAVHTTRSLEPFEVVEVDGIPATDPARTLADTAWRRHDLDLVAAHRVMEGDRLVAELDFAHVESKVAVEIDGLRFHSTPAQKRYDDDRQNRLVARGWTVLRFTLDDLRRRPAQVVRLIRDAILRGPTR